MEEEKITELLSYTINQVDDLRKKYSAISENITAMKQQNTAYRRTILSIEKQILELRLSEFGETLYTATSAPKCNCNKNIEVNADSNSVTEPINEGIEVVAPITGQNSNLEKLFDSANEDPTVTIAKLTKTKVSKKDKSSDTSKNKLNDKRRKITKLVKEIKQPVIEEGGTLFQEFEELDLDNLTKNAEFLSAYTASEEDLKEIEEEERHPNKLGALEAFFSRKGRL